MSNVIFGANKAFYDASDLVGALNSTRIIMVSPYIDKLINVGVAGSAINAVDAQISLQAMSAELPANPKVVATNPTYIFALAKGYLFRAPNASDIDVEGFPVVAFPVEVDDPRWIAAVPGYVILPYRDAGVQVYTTAGVLVSQYDYVLTETSMVGVSLDNTVVYLADGRTGKGVAATLTAGKLDFAPTFAIPGCKDVVALSPDVGYLAVAARHRIAFMDLTDPLAPVFTAARDYQTAVNDLARVGEDEGWVATTSSLEEQDDRFQYPTQHAVYLDGRGVFALSGTTGRLIGTASFKALRAEVVIEDHNPPPEPDETFYLLWTLDNVVQGVVLAENGDKLRKE